MLIPSQKSLFYIPDHVTFLNCAYMAPMLRSVNQAGVSGINTRNEPWTITIDQWFEPAEELKSLFARIISSTKEHIALIPSVSYGTAIAKKNIHLSATQNILVLDQQYPSNIYAWRELARESGAFIITIKKESGQTWTDAILDKIDEHTGLIAIPNCHWTDGSLIDLVRVSKRSREVGSKLVIDASQSLGAYPLDINQIKPDFLVTVGYKWLMGPYNLGYLYVDEKYFTGKPIEYSWLNKKDSEDFTGLVRYTDVYKPGARRFDVGEFSNFIQLPMASAALTQILDWGISNIQETLSLLTNKIAQQARERGMEMPCDESRVGHLIGIRMNETTLAEVSKKLVANQIYVSFRGSSMRVAPHLYNDDKDVDKLFEFLGPVTR